MNVDDRRRYFVVGSIIVEVVTPLFQQQIENDYTCRGFASLQAFVNSQPVVHVLFHLRHKNVRCCTDKANCTNNGSLPVNYSQWDMLYTENPGTGNHHCHCKFTAQPIHLEDLDITLASMILLNCCNLGPADKNAIKELRKLKNNYLSHNAKGRINQTEYMSLWTDLTTNILQLDSTKQDELVRMQHRPLDESLCIKYCIQLLDIEEKLEEINVSIQGMNTSVQSNNTLLQRMNTSMLGYSTLLHGMNESVQNNGAMLQELLYYAKIGMKEQHSNAKVVQDKPYKLGQSIFLLHHQSDLRSVLNCERKGSVTDGVMMDDGRLVLCIYGMKRLLICNTDGSQSDSIPLQYRPWCVTAVNNSTVAVISDDTSTNYQYIEMYDINNKNKLTSIQVRGWWCTGITTINNKLVVHGDGQLYILDEKDEEIQSIYTCTDHQTEDLEVVPTIFEQEGIHVEFRFLTPCVHATGDRIFYSNSTIKLYCYSYTDEKHSTTTLPSTPQRITSLQDGSLYVLCRDGSVQHVSTDGKCYKPVTTNGLTSVRDCKLISYNQKQRKLVTCTEDGTVQVFDETKSTTNLM